MDDEVLSTKELEDIFENREDSKKEEWDAIKEQFYDIGLENIMEEEVDGLTFHVLYYKITSFTDEEIFDHLMEEI